MYNFFNEPKIDMVVESGRWQWLGHTDRMSEEKEICTVSVSVYKRKKDHRKYVEILF